MDFAEAFQDNILLLWGLPRHRSFPEYDPHACFCSKLHLDFAMLGNPLQMRCQRESKTMGLHICTLLPV